MRRRFTLCFRVQVFFWPTRDFKRVIAKYQDELYEGTSVDVNEDGAIIMKTNDGAVMTFVTGDVHAHPDEAFKKEAPSA